ncbi:MAG: DUF11 domain-containing protein, partial [bacterium]|nr:DUF11 domain-containing protein [bacterium]
IDYLDLCGITFDISDVVNDFDFVYFTDNENFQRAALDQDQDGVSDLFFEGRTQNQLKWKPPDGCVRVNLRQCQDGVGFRKECGYAMISVQPKRGFRDGSARISIGVNAKCPPNWSDCSRSYEFVHRYANCFSPALPKFVIQKSVNQEIADNKYQNEGVFHYTVTVRNTSATEKNNTELTDIMSSGTEDGSLRLSFFEIVCPSEATCSLISASAGKFIISLSNIPPNEVVKISYKMMIHKNEIPKGVVSYFTNTATLSTGISARVVVGVLGTSNEPSSSEPERRQERPRQ